MMATVRICCCWRIKSSVVGVLCLLACCVFLMLAVGDDYVRYIRQKQKQGGVWSRGYIGGVSDVGALIGYEMQSELSVNSFRNLVNSRNTSDGSVKNGDAPGTNRWGLSDSKWPSPDEGSGSKHRTGISKLKPREKGNTFQPPAYTNTVGQNQSVHRRLPLPSFPSFHDTHEGYAQDNVSLVSIDTVLNGIYWSDQVEQRIPKGVSPVEADQWIDKSRKMVIETIELPSAERCGRMKNAFITYIDGSHMCARYRAPNNRFIQGEILSYWLARYMEMDNVPPVTISAISSDQWLLHKQTMHSVLKWSSHEYVGTTMWVNDVDNSYFKHSRVLMPDLILASLLSGAPLTRGTLQLYLRNVTCYNNTGDCTPSYGRMSKTKDKVLGAMVALAQWGTMILFDYLTGNYDRVASMQDGADKEKRQEILQEPIRNLRRSQNGGSKLWLIDNESGLLDAYGLMYEESDNGRRFLRFHDNMLHTICLFQKNVVRKLTELNQHTHPHNVIETLASSNEPLFYLIEDSNSLDHFKTKFNKRLNSVVEWIHRCKSEVYR